MQMKPSTREIVDADDLNFSSEFKLIDDSFYRVYDDSDYGTWRERMLSIVELQLKSTTINSESEGYDVTGAVNVDETSSINEVNPIRPVRFELPTETIFAGLKRPPDIEEYKFNVSWGMKYLLADIDQRVDNSAERTKFKTMLMESKPGRSKWNNPNRIGQDELYQGLEKVLLDLKAYTPYSIPFLVKVSKKDVPDYYTVIKKPMDLGSVGKKLKNQEYNSKQHFVDDLNLIYNNCFTYNTAEDSIYRQHVQMLRDKWSYLLKAVPDIVVGKASTMESFTSKRLGEAFTAKRPALQIAATTATESSSSASSSAASISALKPTEDNFDDLDSLLNTHLEGLSDIESSPSPKKSRITSPMRDGTFKSGPITPHISIKEFIPTKGYLPARHSRLMEKFAQDVHSTRNSLDSNLVSRETDSNSSPSHNHVFVFPEILYFNNTVPDTHLFSQSCGSQEFSGKFYNSRPAMNRLYDNFRILQSVRELRKHLLESSRADPPAISHLNEGSAKFSALQLSPIHMAPHARLLLKKIVSMYLGQAGFELISNSTLTTICELVESFIQNFLQSMRNLHENLGLERDSADLLRLGLHQAEVRHLNSLESVMREIDFAKGRLTQLLQILHQRVADVAAHRLKCEEEEREVVEQDEDEEQQEEASFADGTRRRPRQEPIEKYEELNDEDDDPSEEAGVADKQGLNSPALSTLDEDGDTVTDVPPLNSRASSPRPSKRKGVVDQ